MKMLPYNTSELPRRHGVAGRYLLHIGRVEEGRGLDQLVAAFAATVGRREDWSLVFAGAGGARARLRAQAEQLGIGARVHWLGVPRAEERPGLLGSATALPVLADGGEGADPSRRSGPGVRGGQRWQRT